MGLVAQPTAAVTAVGRRYHPRPMTPRPAARAAAVRAGQPHATTVDRDDSESVLRMFQDLSLSGVSEGRIVSLSELDRQIREWYEQEGVSMKKFKEVIRTHAICLGDCKAYHGQKALKQALRADPSKIISREKAKRYKFVKQCLTIL